MMNKRTIKLCYRKVIDSTSQKQWDKLLFEDSYREFLMQAQFYNQEKKYSAFSDIINNVPGAEKLHFLVSSSVIGYLKQLNGIVPDVLNSLGKHFLPFKNYRFEIINSDIKDKSKHQVAINFFSEPLTWHDTIGNQLLISLNEKDENAEYLTELFLMQPFLSIYSLKEDE
jgi:hypothetical protein